jgi:hypothetical protein
VSSGALTTPSGFYSGIAAGGYTYAYSDGNGSTACVDAEAFCGSGTTAAGNGTSTVWGGGIGVNLNQANVMNATANPYPVPSNSYGIEYLVSNVPVTQGMRLVIDDAASGTEYCATVSATSGGIPWTSFNTACWTPSTGTYLAGPPISSTHINFQVPSPYAESGTFNFCVLGVAFY